MDELRCANCGEQIADAEYHAVSTFKSVQDGLSHSTGKKRTDAYWCCQCVEEYEPNCDENGIPETIVWYPPIRRKKTK